jgi:hypothetical protein
MCREFLFDSKAYRYSAFIPEKTCWRAKVLGWNPLICANLCESAGLLSVFPAGANAAAGEWCLVGLAFNSKRLYVLMTA